MSQTLHQIYQKKAIVLARTMVVKFHSVAKQINEMVSDAGYPVDENNPASWKYYMNMFGEYHQYDHDRLLELTDGESKYIVIKVAGETTAVDANFNKELLFGETADQGIANEYRFNTQYYNTLVQKYPEFEDLILGVLNPVSPELSVDADDGEILYCGGYLRTQLSSGDFIYVRQDYGPITDNYLIESNEENLIYILRTYINNYLGRWWNINYVETHDLFLANFIAIMTLSIPQILGNARLMNAKTPQAHSFFIRENLESYGKLGWVAEHLSKASQLWLHRNIRWLTANRGKEKTFDAIVDNVLTVEDVTVAGFRLQHDTSQMLEDGSLSPDPFMERVPLNFKSSDLTRNEIIDIVYKEARLAIENKYDQEGQASKIADDSRYSTYDDVSTKVIESTLKDTRGEEPITYEDIAMNMWLYMSSYGNYRGTVIFSNPFTNERIQMTPLNAYILAFYCFNRGYANYEFETIPDLSARLVTRHSRFTPNDTFNVKPTLNDIRKGIMERSITDAQITSILGSFVPTNSYSSNLTFAQGVEDCYQEYIRKYMEACKIEDARGRGVADWVRHVCYWYDIPCTLTKTPTTYNDWLLLHGFSFNGYSREDFVKLGIEVTQAATGIDLDSSRKLKNKQEAILAILKHFSSYTLQIIQNTITSDSFWLDFKTLRITEDSDRQSATINVKLPSLNAKPRGKLTGAEIWFQTTGQVEDVRIADRRKEDVSFDVIPEVQGVSVSTKMRVKMGLATIVSADIPDVIIDTRVPKYTTLTSFLYPMYVNDTLKYTGQVNAKMVISPALLKWKDTLHADIGTLNGLKVSPHLIKVTDTLNYTGTVNGRMVISIAEDKITETLQWSGRLESSMYLYTPEIMVADTLYGDVQWDKLVVSPQPNKVKDTLTGNAAIGKFVYKDKFQTVKEQLTGSAQLNSIKVYFDRNVEFEDVMGVGITRDRTIDEINTTFGRSVITNVSIVEKPIITSGEIKEED